MKWILAHFSEDNLLNSHKMLILEITVEIISPNTHTLLDKECRFPKKNWETVASGHSGHQRQNFKTFQGF